MDSDGEQTRKLFLGGLNYATNEEGLTTYFSQWGTLVDCVVMRFPDSRRSRGFGFITYSTVEEADACFEAGPHTLDGTKVDLKRATPKDEKNPSGPKGEVLRKIFVGGLNYSTTDDGLKSYFEQFGEIVDCVVMKYKDSDRSRGFGFVTYSSTDMVDLVQNSRPHTIDGTKVETKRATPREESAKGESGKTVKKIFVGGLKDEISDEDLKDYFGQFGTVVSAEQMTDKTSGRKRGFGFVEFDDYDPVDKAILVPRHEINGLKVDIRKALGKNEVGGKDGGFGRRGGDGGRGQAPWGGAQGGYGGGYGDGYGGGYGNGGGWGSQSGNSGYGANPWQSGGGWGDQGSWGSSGGGYMSSGGWGGGYGTGNNGMAGGAMRNSMGGAGNRAAPYSVGGRGGSGGGGGRGMGRGGAPRW